MNRYGHAALGELCNVSIGRTPRRNNPRYWGGPHPWATIRDLDGSTLKATAQGITDAALQEVMPAPVEPNTLLFSFKLSIGKMAFAGRRMHHNEAIAALPVRNPDVLDREFLFYALKAKTHDEGSNHAVLGKVLNKRKVEEIEIPLPPRNEQRRIVGILNRAAKVERLRARERMLMGEFIPALFIRMFGDPIDNPKGYHRKPLSECAVFVSGATPSKQNRAYWDGDVPWITAKDMKVDLIVNSEDHVSQLAFDETNLRLVPANTPIMVVRGMILSHTVPIALTERAVAINQDMKAIEFDNTIDPTFGFWCLKSLRQRILEEVDTAAHGTKRIEMLRLRALPILIPSRELQRRFVGIVGAARTAVSQAESADQGVLALTGSLMARLLADSS